MDSHLHMWLISPIPHWRPSSYGHPVNLSYTVSNWFSSPVKPTGVLPQTTVVEELGQYSAFENLTWRIIELNTFVDSRPNYFWGDMISQKALLYVQNALSSIPQHLQRNLPLYTFTCESLCINLNLMKLVGEIKIRFVFKKSINLQCMHLINYGLVFVTTSACFSSLDIFSLFFLLFFKQNKNMLTFGFELHFQTHSVRMVLKLGKWIQ